MEIVADAGKDIYQKWDTNRKEIRLLALKPGFNS